jgi:hypothetical protein
MRLMTAKQPFFEKLTTEGSMSQEYNSLEDQLQIAESLVLSRKDCFLEKEPSLEEA